MKRYIFDHVRTNILLAPMAGVTDLPFRMVCREFGAGCCFFEMVDVHSLVYGHPRSMRILKTVNKDRPIAVQLLGSDPGRVLEAAQKVIDLLDVAIIDLNAACPAKKVVKKRAGAYLLKDRNSLSKIIKKLSSNLKVPVTVKLRTNYGPRDTDECVKTARSCEDRGAHAVFLHGRTVSQGYAGRVDYECIKRVKASLKVPVIGSGNIFDPQSARQMFLETGCDGILVARGALGRPWIFEEIEGFLKDGRLPRSKTLRFKKRVLKRHLSYIDRFKEMAPRDKLGFMVKVAMWYLKGLPSASRLRNRLCSVRSAEELQRVIERLE